MRPHIRPVGSATYATAPSAGEYRLFLDFQHAGVVRTAEFTLRAGENTGTATAPSAAPAITATTTTVPAAQTQTDISHDDTETGSHGH